MALAGGFGQASILDGTPLEREKPDVRFTFKEDLSKNRPNNPYYPKYLIPEEISTYRMGMGNTDIIESYAHIIGGSANWVLPIPSMLNYESDYNWSEEDLGWQGKTISSITKFFSGQKNNNDPSDNVLLDALKMGGEAARSYLGRMSTDTTVKEMGKDFGAAYNPNKQLYFNDVSMREFTVFFSLAPMSMFEADNIKKSFQALAYSAAPGYAFDKFFFTYPEFFDFAVYTNGIPLLQRKKLAITRLELDFTSDGNLTWHEDGFPTALQMEVAFKETEIPTRTNLANITLFGERLG